MSWHSTESVLSDTSYVKAGLVLAVLWEQNLDGHLYTSPLPTKKNGKKRKLFLFELFPWDNTGSKERI